MVLVKLPRNIFWEAITFDLTTFSVVYLTSVDFLPGPTSTAVVEVKTIDFPCWNFPTSIKPKRTENLFKIKIYKFSNSTIKIRENANSNIFILDHYLIFEKKSK